MDEDFDLFRNKVLLSAIVGCDRMTTDLKDLQEGLCSVELADTLRLFSTARNILTRYARPMIGDVLDNLELQHIANVFLDTAERDAIRVNITTKQDPEPI
jgi:hypothetical protein